MSTLQNSSIESPRGRVLAAARAQPRDDRQRRRLGGAARGAQLHVARPARRPLLGHVRGHDVAQAEAAAGGVLLLPSVGLPEKLRRPLSIHTLTIICYVSIHI